MTDTGATETISEHDAHAIGVAAYIYFYPLVTMDVTRKQLTNVIKPEGMATPMSTFRSLTAFPAADMKVVVRPNFDTLYSSAWLDLTKEPMIVSAPDTHGRFYLLPMLDMWSDVFASPGSRTTGTQAGDFALVPPGWSGSLPADVAGSVRVRAGKYNLRPDRRPRWFRRLQGWPLRSQCDGGSGACGCWRKFVDEGGSGDGGGYAIRRSLDRTGQPIVGT